MTKFKVLVWVLVMGAVALLGAVPGRRDSTVRWCQYERVKGGVHAINEPCTQPPGMDPKIIIIDVSVTPVGPTDPVTDSAQ